jgi:hypothetical protein
MNTLDSSERQVVMKGVVLALSGEMSPHLRTEVLSFASISGSECVLLFEPFLANWPKWADDDAYFLQQSGRGKKLGSYLVTILLRDLRSIEDSTFAPLVELAQKYNVESKVIAVYLASRCLSELVDYTRGLVARGRSLEGQSGAAAHYFGAAAQLDAIGRRNLHEFITLVKQMPESELMTFGRTLKLSLAGDPELLEACLLELGYSDQAR